MSDSIPHIELLLKNKPSFLPFSWGDLKVHFYGNDDARGVEMAKVIHKYQEYMTGRNDGKDFASKSSQNTERQLEKYEPLWTIRHLKEIYDENLLPDLIYNQQSGNFSPQKLQKMIGKSTDTNQEGGLELYFEMNIQPPKSFLNWMIEQKADFHPVKYMQNAFEHNTSKSKNLESASHIDAVFLNRETGFLLMIEAKYLSDCSVDTSFHPYRNQILRNLDILIDLSQNEDRDHNDEILKSFKIDEDGKQKEKKPRFNMEKTFFALLTPSMFRQKSGPVQRRYYSYLYDVYKNDPTALESSLPHLNRNNITFDQVRKNMCWFTFNAHNINQPLIGHNE